MPIPIQLSRVESALLPGLGSAVSDLPSLTGEVAEVLRGWSAYHETLPQLRKRVADCLFRCLYQALGPTMTVFDADGQRKRIYLKDLDQLADDAMAALFESLPVYSVSFNMLREHALQEHSAAAAAVLLQHYGSFLAPGDLEQLEALLPEE